MPSGQSPNITTAHLIKAYAALVIEEYGEDDATNGAPPIFRAALDTQNAEETCFIGRAILCRHESLADSWCRYGRPSYPEQLMVLATRLGWEG